MTDQPWAQVLEPSRGALTRERIVATAADLMHANGMNATSLGEILRAAGAGKGQFYQHFEGRAALVSAVLARHRWYLERRYAAPIRDWEELRSWMEDHLVAMRSYGFVRGCPVGTPAYALQEAQGGERNELQAIFRRMRSRIARFLRDEQRAGRLDATADPVRLAAFTVAAVQGGLLLGLVERRADPVRAAFDEAWAHLRSQVRHGPSKEANLP